MANSDLSHRRLALFGQGPLAVAVLKRLVESNVTVSLVNDSESSDGWLLQEARKHGVKAISRHARKCEEELIDLIDNADSPDFLLSVNYRFIISARVLNLFRWPLNVHGSLLPKYRGRTPHVWAIINGERKTGITLHLMDEGIDTGPIVEQVVVEIGETTTGADLLLSFEELYPEVVVTGLRSLISGAQPREQTERDATFFGKRTPEMGLIDFRCEYSDIHNFVRALAPPYPGAYCYLPTGERLTVTAVKPVKLEDETSLPWFSPRRMGDSVIVKAKSGTLELIVSDRDEGRTT